MKWNVNHIICKLSVISSTSVLAAAILMQMPRINLSRRVHYDQGSSTPLKLDGGANIGRKNVMSCGTLIHGHECVRRSASYMCVYFRGGG
jgi:hypothetical protein